MILTKKQCFIILNILAGVLVISYMFHETFLTNLDKIIMPFTEEFCNLQPNILAQKVKAYSSIDQIELDLTDLKLQFGGKREPSEDIQPTNRIAIIVPYRDRKKNLEYFLQYIHRFLSRQNITYKVYIVEPIKKLTFNKGISMNAGFVEAIKDNQNWDCFIFHDVDLLPENNNIIYTCDKNIPKLIAVAISAYNYTVDGYFAQYFGGVTAFTKDQFKSINGFSNQYFGWGLEDDDARNRVIAKYKQIKKLDASVGRFYANCHKQQKRNPDRFLVYLKSKYTFETDGLNSLQYKVESIETRYLYTKFYISYENNI